MLTPRQIHERLRDHLVQVLSTPASPGAWTESRHPWSMFLTLPSKDHDHHSFAIGMPSMAPTGADRQQGFTQSTTQLSIRWAHRLRIEAAVADKLDAYEAENELICACKTMAIPKLPLVLVSVTRTDTRDGLLQLGEVLYDLPHLYPLTR